jgi:hypothetical protein
MGWTSIDALVNDITVNGKFLKIPFNRTIYTSATSVAGRWHELLSAGGTGGPMVVTGTAGAGAAYTSASPGALPIGSNTGTDIKRLLSMSAVTNSATVAPAYLVLTDILHMYRSCTFVTTPTALSGHPTWTGTGDTRMTNANGVMVSVMETTASTVAAQITLTYTNQAGVGSRTIAAPGGSLFAPVAATPAGALLGQTGTAATVGGPYTPLMVGDYGVQSVQSYAINTSGTGGAGAIVLHRPIATIPIALANLASERDFLAGIPTLPRIYDDACLGFFIMVGGALTAGSVVSGELNFGWGA